MEVLLDGVSFSLFGTMLAFGAYCFYVICRLEYYRWLDNRKITNKEETK